MYKIKANNKNYNQKKTNMVLYGATPALGSRCIANLLWKRQGTKNSSPSDSLRNTIREGKNFMVTEVQIHTSKGWKYSVRFQGTNIAKMKNENRKENGTHIYINAFQRKFSTVLQELK